MKNSRYQYQKIAPVHARTGINGRVFHSKTEKDRFEYLRLLAMANEITDLECQVKFTLERGDIKIMAGNRVAHYTADFVYTEKGTRVVEDVKGYPDEQSRLRIRVFEALHGQKVNILKRERGNGWIQT